MQTELGLPTATVRGNSLSDRAVVFEKLTNVATRLVEVERKVYGLDKTPESPTAGVEYWLKVLAERERARSNPQPADITGESQRIVDSAPQEIDRSSPA